MPLQVKIKSPEGGTLKTANTYIEDDINIIPNLQDKTITQNGEYTADEGYAGLGNIQIQVVGEGGVDTSQDTVTADTMLEGTTAHGASGEIITGTIPTYVGANPEIVRNNDVMILPTAKKYCANDITIQPALQDKTVTENGTVTADEGYAGLGEVTVNVASSEPKLQEKTVTANGEVTPDEGYDGLLKVTVGVANNGINVVSNATGYIPDYDKATAESTITIMGISVTSTAVGSLEE